MIFRYKKNKTKGQRNETLIQINKTLIINK